MDSCRPGFGAVAGRKSLEKDLLGSGQLASLSTLSVPILAGIGMIVSGFPEILENARSVNAASLNPVDVTAVAQSPE